MKRKERDEILKLLLQGKNDTDRTLKSLQKNQEELNNKYGALVEGQEQLNRKYEQLSQGQKEIRKDLKSLENTVTRIEFEHGEKLDALFDAFTFHSEKLKSQENRIDACENKLDIHADEIYYLKSKVQGL